MKRPSGYRGYSSPDDFLNPELIARYLPRLIKYMAAGLVVLWMLSGVYMVGPGERGLVLTFGRLTNLTSPGLNFRLPRPFQAHAIVDISQVRTAEIGYRTEGGRVNTVNAEAQMLTGDENLVEVQLFVQYLVQDPVAFLFEVRNAENVLLTSAEIALRSTVGQNTIDFTMTEGRVEAQNQVKALLQDLLDEYRTGLIVTETRLLAVDPPLEVRDAFHDVVRAFEDRERLVQEAQGYAERVVPAARGDAAQLVLEAEAYREQRVIRSEGDATRFLALVEEYRRAPEVMRERLYLESIENILGESNIFILDTTNSGVLPFLPLNSQAESPAPAPAAAPAVVIPTPAPDSSNTTP
jgi:modulator of FtsH protease HflK